MFPAGVASGRRLMFRCLGWSRLRPHFVSGLLESGGRNWSADTKMSKGRSPDDDDATCSPNAGDNVVSIGDVSRNGEFGLSLRVARAVQPLSSPGAPHLMCVAFAPAHTRFKRTNTDTNCLHKVELAVLKYNKDP